MWYQNHTMAPTDRNKQIMVVVTIILFLSAYMIQLSHFHLYLGFFFEVILEKYCNLCKSCEEQLGTHHTCSEIYGAADSDGKVHSFRTKNALCQLLKLLKIIEVILPFIKKVLKLEPCSIPRTFVRHTVQQLKLQEKLQNTRAQKSPGSLPGLLSSKFVSVCNGLKRKNSGWILFQISWSKKIARR